MLATVSVSLLRSTDFHAFIKKGERLVMVNFKGQEQIWSLLSWKPRRPVYSRVPQCDGQVWWSTQELLFRTNLFCCFCL